VTPPGSRQSPASHGPGRRQFSAAYKLRVLEQYGQLDKAGKTSLLRREGLRASQVSQWRHQQAAAAAQALNRQPGSRPARVIHVSDPLWERFSEAVAAQNPGYTPQRVIQMYIRYHAGVTDVLPNRVAPAGEPAAPAAAGAP
jgi:transposase-like protein